LTVGFKYVNLSQMSIGGAQFAALTPIQQEEEANISRPVLSTIVRIFLVLLGEKHE